MTEIEVSDHAADRLRDAEPDVRDRITSKPRSIEDCPDHHLQRTSGAPYYRLSASATTV